MRPTIVPFKAEHILSFRNRDGNPIGSVQSALEKEKYGIAFTAVLEGRVLGCAGIIILPEVVKGVGFCWASFSKELSNHMFWITRQIRNGLRDTILAYDLHRVEMVALADNPINCRWAAYLGFTRERHGLARGLAGVNADMVRFEWVKTNG